MSTQEWSTLMQAPWGRFDKTSQELKEGAIENYKKETLYFWGKRIKVCETFNNKEHKYSECKDCQHNERILDTYTNILEKQ